MTLLFDRADSGAAFSTDRRYRYHLWRTWGPGPLFVVIGLNPSTADELADDPTIRRCIGFAKREGCGGYAMLNLFGWRSTDPHVLPAVADPVGPDNDRIIRDVALGPSKPAVVLAAWGTHGILGDRDRAVMALLGGAVVHCLGTNANGTPKHPLYLANTTPMVVYRGRP